MTRSALATLVLAAMGSLGAPCGGSSVLLWTETPVVTMNEEIVVLVESRNFLANGFAFRLNYPAPGVLPAGGGRLELVGGVDLAHGQGDLAALTTTPSAGEVTVFAANTVDNPSLSAPSNGIVLAALRFRAVEAGAAVLHLQSAKLGSIAAGDPAWLTIRPKPALGAPLTIQVVP